MEKQLQELLDRQACEDVLMRYGRTLDWLDETGQEACFWPDAELDYDFFKGSGADWTALVMKVEAASARRWHLCGGVVINLDGDSARAESYGLTVAAQENKDGELVDTMFGGRYLDELEKRDGQWRISKRTYIADWANQFPDGMKALRDNGVQLHGLQISEPGHEMYRPL
jgi:hypothetical protein